MKHRGRKTQSYEVEDRVPCLVFVPHWPRRKSFMLVGGLSKFEPLWWIGVQIQSTTKDDVQI